MSALDQAFELSVIISIVDRFSGQIKNFVKKMAEAKKINEDTMASIQKWTKIGVGITAFGVAGATAIVKMANAAAKFQTGMVGIQQTMKLTTAQTQDLAKEVQRVGIPTIFSAEQVSGIAQAMANAGIPNFQALQKLLPLYTNFADVQAQLKGESATNAVGTAVTMAHAFQLYSANQLAPFLQELNAMTLHSNETISEVATAWKYTAPTTKLLGMNAQETLAAIAFGQRMGLGARTGTDLKDFFQHLIPGAQGGAESIAAMQTAGFLRTNGTSVFTDAKGHFLGWQNAIQQLQAFADRMGHNANRMLPILNAVFGQQGGLLANMLAAGNALDLYNMTQKQIANTSSIDSIQSSLNKTLAGQEKQFSSTLQDIMLAFSTNGILNPLTVVLEKLNAMAGAVLHFVQNHPKIDKMIGAFLQLATAVALVVGPLTLMTQAGRLFMAVWSDSWLMKAARGLLMFARSEQMAAIGARLVQLALGPVGWIMLGVSAAAALLYEAWRHNWLNIHQVVKNAVDQIKKHWDVLLASVMPVIGIPILIYRHWSQIKNWAKEAAQWGENLIKSFADGIMNGIHWVESAVTKIGKRIEDFLHLHSPAREGPLSTLDQWFTPFVPTLMSGLNTGAASTTMTRFAGALKQSFTTAPGSSTTAYGGTGSIVVQVTFQPGSVIAPNPDQAAYKVASLFRSQVGDALGRDLQAASRSLPTGVQPNVF